MEPNTMVENVVVANNFDGRKEGSLHNPAGFNTALLTLKGFERSWFSFRVRLTIFLIAIKCYRSFSKTFKAIKALLKLKKNIFGNNNRRRCIKVAGKYYSALYVPPFPSRVFNRFIQTELNSLLPHQQTVNNLQVVQLAITSKCPMKCEHCFEWKNLNKPEVFTTEELKMIIKAFQQKGCSTFHFTGGEPLVKMDRLVELIQYASSCSACWVLTSGLNLSFENATRLKKAGAIGVVISLDHFDPILHNTFRGSEHAFEGAMNAVNNANRVNLVTAFSICLSRSFISQKNLEQYADLAKECGVSFVQLLEPRAVGHYEGKAVSLSNEQIELLNTFYLDINFNKRFKDYPVFIYHGYHQRKIGCLSAGNHILYIDAAGYIDACPFCQTKSYNAFDLIEGHIKVGDIKMEGCPAYKKTN